MSDILARVQADREQNSRFWQRFQLLWSGLFVLVTAVSVNILAPWHSAARAKAWTVATGSA